MVDSFLRRIITKPPVLFPLVALFHLLMLIYSIWNFYGFPLFSIYWISTLWVLVYTVTWLFVCDLKRWAMSVYTGLSALSVVLQYFISNKSDLQLYTPSFYVIYLLFTFFILFYYKKFS